MRPKKRTGLVILVVALFAFTIFPCLLSPVSCSLPFAWAQEAAKEAAPRSSGIHLNWSDILSTIVYGLIGIFLAVVGYFIFDWITPYSLGKELVEDKNMAVAMVVAAVLISVSIIVAAVMR